MDLKNSAKKFLKSLGIGLLVGSIAYIVLGTSGSAAEALMLGVFYLEWTIQTLKEEAFGIFNEKGK